MSKNQMTKESIEHRMALLDELFQPLLLRRIEEGHNCVICKTSFEAIGSTRTKFLEGTDIYICDNCRSEQPHVKWPLADCPAYFDSLKREADGCEECGEKEELHCCGDIPMNGGRYLCSECCEKQ